METVIFSSISLDIVGIGMTLIILLGLVMNKNQKTRLDRLFAAALICNLLKLLVDIPTFSLIGAHGSFYHSLVEIATSCYCILQYILYAVLTAYLAAYANEKTKVSKIVLPVVLGIFVIGTLLIIFSHFTNFIYYIDSENIYHRSDWFWLITVTGLCNVLVSLLIIIVYYRSFSNRERFFLFLFFFMPLSANLIQLFYYTVSFGNIAMCLALLCFYAGLQSRQALRLKEKEVELLESKISVMLSQIKPHFLYNSLTAISALCSVDAEKAQDALESFAHYLRGNLDSLGQRQLIPFESELEHLKLYLKLEQMRFEDKINVVYDLEAVKFLIPVLIIQPLAENAVRYGITKKPQGGTLTIVTRETAGEIVITVNDDGNGFDVSAALESDGHHVGIKNVAARLEMQISGKLTVESTIGTGTTATIRIPKEA